MYSFPYLEPVCCFMSSSNCCFLTCIQISQEAGQVVWYSQLLKNFPEFVVVHTVKGFGIVNKAEVDVFLELSWIKYRLGLSSFRINWWRWWRTGKPGVLQSVGSQRVRHNWATEQQQFRIKVSLKRHLPVLDSALHINSYIVTLE